MANYPLNPGDIAAHAKVLVANAPDTVTFADPFEAIEIISSGTADIYVTLDGTVPTVAGGHCIRIPAATNPTAPSRVVHANGTATVVSLVSSGTPTYSVQHVR